MPDQPYRSELKHYINAADRLALRARLRHIAKPDRNASPDGCYTVRSLYFDNYADKAVTEKLAGLSRREKFRLRYYNDDTSFIRLEQKSKINRGCIKRSVTVTTAQCERIIRGDFESLVTDDKPLLTEFCAKSRFQNLRPRMVVTYLREAYIYPAGNVRITIDSDIRASHNTASFLDPRAPTIPSANANAIILEIKFDGFLPDIIRNLVQLGSRHETEFSKYIVSRFF